jgi:dihydrofolate reductase
MKTIMKKPTVSIIAAISRNRVLANSQGKTWREQIPWYIPEDLEYFKTRTENRTVIMGRKTFESIGNALKNRRNIVVTKNIYFQAPGCELAHTLNQAIALARAVESKEIFIIGGAEIYTQALDQDLVQTMYLTVVDKECSGDIVFPKFESKFQLKSSINKQNLNYSWQWQTWEKNHNDL